VITALKQLVPSAANCTVVATNEALAPDLKQGAHALAEWAVQGLS